MGYEIGEPAFVIISALYEVFKEDIKDRAGTMTETTSDNVSRKDDLVGGRSLQQHDLKKNYFRTTTNQSIRVRSVHFASEMSSLRPCIRQAYSHHKGLVRGGC